jgi:hypothetical protein
MGNNQMAMNESQIVQEGVSFRGQSGRKQLSGKPAASDPERTSRQPENIYRPVTEAQRRIRGVGW